MANSASICFGLALGLGLAPSSSPASGPFPASQLARLDAPTTLRVENGQATLRFALPWQAVSLVQLDW